ncbi:GNAT family N-acetyltransferase [Bdellovibrio svalbardensis]|uniref:GNAT family N-acetyltransferase n=1 Tax=Bdellovibrio svalbardensis TaxID=2972972 RepID=A0ABT6DF84_9BACT|nr:GNAT family N-acetyltransferase [Bdellovibrio svalbardensis]MDG0815169.1 GNAT family N-acetyltransferase [Bdellovibrio svalbardensis]
MSNNIQITWATENDIPTILHFIKELAKYEKLEHEAIATAESMKKNLFGDRKFAEVIFLEESSKKVGFALFFHSFSTFLGAPGLYLEDLFVLPEYRGKGYGKKLLSTLAKIAVERECGRLEWSVLDWNQPAIDLYLSMGSKPMDEWTVHRVTGEALKNLAHQTI